MNHGMNTARTRHTTVRAATSLMRIHELQHQLVSSPWMHDVIELAMAAAISTPIADEDGTALVWLIVEGSPSGGKTDCVMALRDCRKVVYVDNVTANALSSGYMPPEGKPRKPDLLTHIQTEGATCLAIKDLSPLFSAKDEKVKAILGELTAIYDRQYHKWTGNMGGLEHQPSFSIVACITPLALAKHQNYMGQLGPRFLMYRVSMLSSEEQALGMRRVWDESRNRMATMSELRSCVSGHVNDLLTTPPPPVTVGLEEQNEINRLTNLLIRGRALTIWVTTANDSREIEDVQREEPFRALQQLRNLIRALAVVRGRTHVTQAELELVRRVVLSSIPLGRHKVLGAFRKHPQGLTRKLCAETLDMSPDRAGQLLEELRRCELVDAREGASIGGAPPVFYTLASEWADLILKPVEPLDHVRELQNFADDFSPQDRRTDRGYVRLGEELSEKSA